MKEIIQVPKIFNTLQCLPSKQGKRFRFSKMKRQTTCNKPGHDDHRIILTRALAARYLTHATFLWDTLSSFDYHASDLEQNVRTLYLVFYSHKMINDKTFLINWTLCHRQRINFNLNSNTLCQMAREINTIFTT